VAGGQISQDQIKRSDKISQNKKKVSVDQKSKKFKIVLIK
jgi:hypothetical protein